MSARDVDDIYKVPLVFSEQGVDDFILEHFGLEAPAPDLSDWREPIERAERADAHGHDRDRRQVRAARDAYLSVSEALRHAAALQGGAGAIEWIDSEQPRRTPRPEATRAAGSGARPTES